MDNNSTLLHYTQTEKMDWKPLNEEGVKTSGIFVKVLRYDEETQRVPVIRLKFKPGAKYPVHNHPAGEGVFVIEGEVKFGNNSLSAGDYLYTPPKGIMPFGVKPDA